LNILYNFNTLISTNNGKNHSTVYENSASAIIFWNYHGLVLESVGHIAKLIDEDPEKLFLQQSIILSKL